MTAPESGTGNSGTGNSGTGNSGTGNTNIDPNANNGGGNTDSGTGTQPPEGKFTQADIDRVVAERVRRLNDKYADYDDLKKKAAAAMTDQEKAVAEAEARGKNAVLTESGKRLARAEFMVRAADRVDKDALAGFLEYAAMDKFVGSDGEPDTKAIDAAITKLAGPAKSPNFDGGARTPGSKPIDMNALIRQKAGFAA